MSRSLAPSRGSGPCWGSQEEGTPDLAGGTPRAGGSRAMPWEAGFTPGGKREKGIPGLSCTPGVCTHCTTVCGLGATKSLINGQAVLLTWYSTPGLGVTQC